MRINTKRSTKQEMIPVNTNTDALSNVAKFCYKVVAYPGDRFASAKVFQSLLKVRKTESEKCFNK